jgi:hypothetical protein
MRVARPESTVRPDPTLLREIHAGVAPEQRAAVTELLAAGGAADPAQARRLVEAAAALAGAAQTMNAAARTAQDGDARRERLMWAVSDLAVSYYAAHAAITAAAEQLGAEDGAGACLAAAELLVVRVCDAARATRLRVDAGPAGGGAIDVDAAEAEAAAALLDG